MKKIILTTIISFGLAFAANAQKRGHQSNGHDRHDNDRRTSSHSSHRGHDSHRGHSSYGQRGHDSHRGHSSYGHRGYSHSSSHVSYTTQRVWVAGCAKRVWVAPRYEYVRRPCGTLVRVCVSNGYYHTVQSPGYYTYKRVPVYRSKSHCNSRTGLSISWRW